MIADWFIKEDYGDSPLMTYWLDEVITFWKWRIKFTNQKKYMQWIAWHHYSFRIAYDKYDDFRNIWDRVDKINCNTGTSQGPHRFVPYQHYGSISADSNLINRINSKVDTCYKLTRRLEYQPGSAINYLLNTI